MLLGLIVSCQACKILISLPLLDRVCIAPSSRCQLKLRTAIDGNTGTGGPACLVRSQKRDYICHFFRLADSLVLAPKSGLVTRFSPSEVRPVRVDHTGRDRICADTSGPKNGSPVLDKSF